MIGVASFNNRAGILSRPVAFFALGDLTCLKTKDLETRQNSSFLSVNNLWQEKTFPVRFKAATSLPTVVVNNLLFNSKFTYSMVHNSYNYIYFGVFGVQNEQKEVNAGSTVS